MIFMKRLVTMKRFNWIPTVNLLCTVLLIVSILPSTKCEELCSVDEDCLDKGKCVNNTCLCDSNYFGNHCEFEHKEGIYAVKITINNTLELVFVNSTTNTVTSTSVNGLSSTELSQQFNISRYTPSTSAINAEDGILYVGLEPLNSTCDNGWLIGIFTLNSSLILAQKLPHHLVSLEYDPTASPTTLYAVDNLSNVVRLTITYQYDYLYETYNYSSNSTTVNYDILANYLIHGKSLPSATALDFTGGVFYMLLDNNETIYTLIAFNVQNDTIDVRADVPNNIVALEFDSLGGSLYVVTFNSSTLLYQLQKMDVATQTTVTIVYSYDFANTTIAYGNVIINSTNLQNVTLYNFRSYLDGDLFFIYARVDYVDSDTLLKHSDLLFGVDIHNSENASLSYHSNSDGSVTVVLPEQLYYSSVNIDLPYGCDGLPGSQQVYDWCGLCTAPDDPYVVNDTFHEECQNGGYYIPAQCGNCTCNFTLWTGSFCELPVCDLSCPFGQCIAPGVCAGGDQPSSNHTNPDGTWVEDAVDYVQDGIVDNPYYTAAIGVGICLVVGGLIGFCVRRRLKKRNAEKKKLISENMQEMESVMKAHMHVNPTNMVSRIDSTVLTDHDSEIDGEPDHGLLRDIEQGIFRRARTETAGSNADAMLLEPIRQPSPNHQSVPLSPTPSPISRAPIHKSPSAQSNISQSSHGKLITSVPSSPASMSEEEPTRTRSTKGFFSSRSKSKVTDWWEIDFDDLQLLDKLGEGSFGIVYKALYRDQDVAFKTVKELSESQLNDFKREAALMVTLKPHQNVVKFYGVCIDPNKPCGIVIEYMLGSLKKMLQHEMQNLTYLQIIGVAKDIAKGMKHLHQEKIVHRDLSARNILVNETKKGWVCKVADFGLARPIDLNSIGKTQSNFGPLKWMAPESLIYKVYSAKSDVWSFACTILEVLDGGRDPFPDLDPVQAASSVMHKNVRPQIPDNCPPKLEFLLSECFQRNADQRPDFKTILSLLDEVEKDIKNNPFYQK